MPCFLLVLLHQFIVQILQDRHILRTGIIEIRLIDLMHTAVDDRLFDRLQSFLAADYQLAERQDEVSFQGDRIIFFGIVHIDVHRVNVLRAHRTDLDHLAAQSLHQRRILRFRIGNDNVVIRHQECIGDLTLGAEGFTGTRCTEDQAVGILQKLPVHHNQVVR